MREAGANESCAACGATLAADQRYCLECGRRRGDTRVDYGLYLAAAASLDRPEDDAAAHGGAGEASAIEGRDGLEAPGHPAPVTSPQTQPERPAAREVTPLMAAAGLAALGAILIAGVLIGRGSAPEPAVATMPQVVQVGAAPVGTAPQPTSASGDGAAAGGENDAENESAGKDGQDGRQGGSSQKKKNAERDGGSSKSAAAPGQVSPEALEQLEEATGEEFQEAQKRLPPEVATPGKAPPKDNKAPGGDSAGDPMVIG